LTRKKGKSDDEDEDDEKSESYDMSDDIDALVSGEDLSEEFQNKAKVVFEAAVTAKVKEVKEELESQKRDEIVEASNEIKEELVGKVDSFLGYVAEEWVKDNELAIERGLKSELTENFIQGLKSLFEDHYVEVPDDKLDVVDELASKIEEVEAKLNEEVSKNIDLSQERDELVRTQVVGQVSKDLTESEVEKLTKLIEDLDQDEDFESNVKTIKESYFSDSKETLQLDEEVVSDSDENTSTENRVLNPSMAAYSAALGKVDPNKYS
jgi:SHS2 domain-containing protein